MMPQGKEGKVMQVYRKKWVIHIERVNREKVNGACPTHSGRHSSLGSFLTTTRDSCCCCTEERQRCCHRCGH